MWMEPVYGEGFGIYANPGTWPMTRAMLLQNVVEILETWFVSFQRYFGRVVTCDTPNFCAWLLWIFSPCVSAHTYN